MYVDYSDGIKALVVNSLQSDNNLKTVVGGREDLPVAIHTSDLAPMGQITATNGTVKPVGDMTVFTPNPNYNDNSGSPASFTYTNSSGNNVTVNIPLAPVNDAPEIINQGAPRAVYAYTVIRHDGNHFQYKPIYEKNGSGVNLAGEPIVLNEDSAPLLYDKNSGKFTVKDSDDSTFTYTITGTPHHSNAILETSGEWGIVADDYNGEDAFRVQVTDSHKASGSFVVNFNPLQDIPLPQVADPGMVAKRAPGTITGFTPGTDGNTPAQSTLSYRSRILAGKTAATLGDVVTSLAYVFSPPDYLTLTILGKDGAGNVTERETLTLDRDTGKVTDIFEIGISGDAAQKPKASITTYTYPNGYQTDSWAFTDGSLAGTDVYNTDGSHTGVVTQNIKNPDGSTITKQTTNVDTHTGTTTTTLTTTVNADGAPSTTTTTSAPPPLSAPKPTVTIPVVNQPKSPAPAQVFSDAVASFQKNNTNISFRIDPDGTTHLSYTNPDGTANSFDAGTDGRYTASRTPRTA